MVPSLGFIVKAPPVKSLTVVEWARKKKRDRQKGIIKRIGVDFILFIFDFYEYI